MSSKLVKKSLELVCSSSETVKKQKSKNGDSNVARGTRKGLGRVNKTKKRKTEIKNFKKKRAKANDKSQDFTEANLEYLSNTSWKLDQNIYETVIKHYADKKHPGEAPQDKPISFDQESSSE